MSKALKQIARSTGPRMRTLLQSMDTARFHEDAASDTKIDIDQARSEILSALLFGHEIVVPAGAVADCPAAHTLLPEVLAHSRVARKHIKSDTGQNYYPIRLGVEEQFVESDPHGYDAFIRHSIADERERLAPYVILQKVAPDIERRKLLVTLGESYLTRKAGRRGAAIEIDPLYCDTGLRRLMEASGLDAVRDDGRRFVDLEIEANREMTDDEG